MSVGRRVTLEVGATILGNRGRVIVAALQPNGVLVSAGGNETTYLSYAELEASEPADAVATAVHVSLYPWWQGLDPEARKDSLWRQEVVLEIVTGYRSGNAELAQPGEPFHPFDPSDRASERTRRCIMSTRLEGEGRFVSIATLHNWIRAWEAEGLRGLVDGRRTKTVSDFEGVNATFKAMVEQALDTLDGGRSEVSTSEIRRWVFSRIAKEGIALSVVPQRLGDEYIAFMRKLKGRSPRQASAALARKRAGFGSTDLLHPSHVCMDVTRADNLVWDADLTRPISVEIITVLSVSTRVVLACRVVPRSATSLEAGLAMYDAMRPLSMLVEGTTVHDWRWAGLPQSLSLKLPDQYRNPNTDLQGVHWIPSVRPSSLRTDHGANFMSDHFLSVLREFGIDLLPSRVGAPTDNAFVERWHETIQRGLQQLPGYKGRNVQQRGTSVAAEPLLTSGQLEQYLHRFIALDYHRNIHEGLALPGLEHGRFTPLEYFDVMLGATGRIDVPQRPDLVYQFLPVVWLTPNGSGVERKNLSYDGPAMQGFRRIKEGTFQKGTAKMPFHFDPRDVSRLWFRHPETDRIHEIRWRGAAMLDAPMTDRMLGRAIKLIRQRGGNRALKRMTATRQIIEALGELATDLSPETAADKLRWAAAVKDHGDAADALAMSTAPYTSQPDPQLDLDQPWPDYGEAVG